MLGWMDDEALRRTLTEGRVTFWSRSRGEYWRKGDTSGHVQHVRSVALDCDGDALLVRVDQVGAACHTGGRTCFDADDLGAGSGERREHGDRGSTTAPDLAFGADLAVPRDLQRAGPGPAGHPRRAPPHGATPRPRSGSTASWPGTGPGTFLLESAEHGGVWSRYSIVGAAVPGDPDRAGRPGRTGSASRRSASPRAATRVEALRDTVAALATEPIDGPAAADRRHGRRHHATTRCGAGSGCPTTTPDELGCPRSR